MENKTTPFAFVPLAVINAVRSPTELAVMTSLYSFSNSQGECYPSLSSIAQRAHVDRSTVIRVLPILEGLRLFRKTVRKKPGYRASDSTFYQLQTRCVAPLASSATPLGVDAQNNQLGAQEEEGRCTAPPEQYQEQKREKGSPTRKENREKKPYGKAQDVLLTDSEYLELVNKFSKSAVELKIEDLSDYCKSKGKEYTSHAATLRLWLRKDSNGSTTTQHAPIEEPRTHTDKHCPVCDVFVPANSVACPKCGCPANQMEAKND